MPATGTGVDRSRYALESVSDQPPILNEVDTYGPAYMRVAEQLGRYEGNEEEAPLAMTCSALSRGRPRARRRLRPRPLRRCPRRERDRRGRGRHLRDRDRRSEARVPRPDLLRRRPDAAAAAGAARLRRPGQPLLELRLRRDRGRGRGDAARLPRRCCGRAARWRWSSPTWSARATGSRPTRAWSSARPTASQETLDVELLDRDAARALRLRRRRGRLAHPHVRGRRPASGWPKRPASARSSATATSPAAPKRPEDRLVLVATA